MFCGNCGKQNPDGANFCTGCGKPLNSAPVRQASPVQKQAPVYQAPPVQKQAPVYQAPPAQKQAPVYQAPPVQQTPVQQAAPAKKKSGGAKKIIIAVVVVLFIVAGLVATMWEGGFGSAPDVEPSSGAPSQAFSNLLWNNNINTPDSDFAGQGLNTVSYAIALDGGIVEILEYVYDDGYVLAYIDTMYFPIYGQTEEYKAALDESVRTNLAQLTSLSFCQLSSYEDNGFYVYKLIYTDLDKKENVRQLSNTNVVILPENGKSVDKIGIKFTEDSLLAQGYVKR